MNLLDKVQKLALQSREMGNHQLTGLLYSVAMDVALTESNRYLQGQLKTAIAETKRVKSDLESIHMYKLSEELDVISRDLEARLIQFSAEDPIQAVLNSYQIIHKIAQVKEEPTVNIRDILSIAEDDFLSDEELVTEIKKRTMGLSAEDKQNILYVLEKDYNISIPLEKIAAISQEDAHEVSEGDLIKNPKTKEQKEHNKKLVEKKINEIGKPTKENKDQWMQSFPSSPSVWSGFAYEAIVPYQQSNQMNFWSLASVKPFTSKYAEQLSIYTIFIDFNKDGHFKQADLQFTAHSEKEALQIMYSTKPKNITDIKINSIHKSTK